MVTVVTLTASIAQCIEKLNLYVVHNVEMNVTLFINCPQNFFSVFKSLFERERERERVSVWALEGQRGGERGNATQALHWQHWALCRAWTHEPWEPRVGHLTEPPRRSSNQIKKFFKD